MNHLAQTFCLLAVRDFISFAIFYFIFWYYLCCIEITFIIIPAVIYVFLHPNASLRLLIQPNCTLIFMLILTPPALPPPSPKRISYESFHRKNFSFCPSHSTQRMLIYCIAFAECYYLTSEPHFFKKFHLLKKKNLRWWSLAYIHQLILFISLDRMLYFE